MTTWSPGLEQFKQTYQVNPIFLTRGIASNAQGGGMPILSLTDSGMFPGGLGGDPETTSNGDDYFALFEPIPGGTLIDQSIGKYPFANQAVAANAVITNPLRISMMMICPARPGMPFSLKLAIMQNLQSSLRKHNQLGGTYTVITPSAFYTDCLMTAMVDASTAQSQQPQFQWRLDFEQPLITLQQAQQQLNAAMNKISTGVQTNGETSGRSLTVNQPGTNAAPSTIPAASGNIGGGSGQFLGTF